MADDLYYVGVQGTVLDFEGSQVSIGTNTVVHRDSAIRTAYPSLFTPLVVHFDAAPTKAEVKAAAKEAKAEEKAEVKGDKAGTTVELKADKVEVSADKVEVKSPDPTRRHTR